VKWGSYWDSCWDSWDRTGPESAVQLADVPDKNRSAPDVGGPLPTATNQKAGGSNPSGDTTV
jgi:hypothetical protein